MFWRFAFQANAVSFETLLDKLDQAEEDTRVSSDDQSTDSESISHAWDNELEAVLKDAELLQELKKGNDRLLHWLSKPEVIAKLFNWVFENGIAPGNKQAQKQGSSAEEGINKKEETNDSNEDDSKKETSSSSNILDDEIISTGVGAFVENSSKAEEELAAGKRKLALISLEILAFENLIIQDTILRYPDNALQKLWDIIYLPPNTQIPPHLSLAFGRIFTSLIARRTRQALAFLYEQKDTVKSILDHLDDTMVLDILLKLLCLEEMSDGQGVAEWLHAQGLIQMLVDRMDPKYGYDIHSNVSQVLLHILAISQAPPTATGQSGNPQTNFGFDPVTGQPYASRCYSLVKDLTSEVTLNRIVYYMLDVPLPVELLEKDPFLPSSQLISSLTFGVTIFIEIIRRHFLDSDTDHHGQSSARNSRSPSPSPPLSASQTSTPPLVDLGILISILTRRLPDFVKLLREPRSINQPISNTSGTFIPLGFERLKVCELIAELLHGSNMKSLNITPAPLGAEEINRLIEKRDSFLDKPGLESFIDPVPLIATKKIKPSVSDKPSLGKFDQFGVSEETTQTPEEPVSESVDSFVEDKKVEEPEEINDDNPIPEMESLSISKATEKKISIGEWAKLSILDNDVLIVFLDLFQSYPWNNFVHVVVFDIIHQVLNLPTDHITNLSLISSLFINAKITERILNIQNSNDNTTSNSSGIRLGYMGYLTFIAEETVKLIDRAGFELGERVQKFAHSPSWQEYVYQALSETKKRDMEPLDGNMTNYSPGPSTLTTPSANLQYNDSKTASNLDHITDSITSTEGEINIQTGSLNEQLNSSTSDHFNNLEPNSFSNSRWGVEDDEDDDEDEEDDDELGLHRPIPTHFSSPPSM
ncbi:SAPS-domain-containing protein [Neoconidiobolus thromboides FSU 785]|nr:SAPS-domain-containing protein [Neoconidiobolus thromboides FSU 785]